MAGVHKSHRGWTLSAVVCSLEGRLVGALALIVLCVGALQLVSQDRAFLLRGQSDALRAATSNAEQAEQLVKSVSRFRLASHRYLVLEPGAEKARAADDMTDAAIRIGDQVNGLRMRGMAQDEVQARDVAVFDGVDRHVTAILNAARTERVWPGTRAALESRNARMATLAMTIEAAARAARDKAHDQLSQSVGSWHLLVGVAGSVTVALALLILFDLLRNILPALRRMHMALRRLADGDLDFEIETFHLRELRALSGSLETFRRNAQAVKNLAYTDPSSGLPNRRAFVERATARLAVGGRDDADAPALVVILADVDRFKHVNDDYGHAAGDRLVRLIGERIAERLGSAAIVARVGGDEFAICTALDTAHCAVTLGADLADAMRAPFDLGDFTVAVSLSLGVVEAAAGDRDVNVLLNRADMALYASKNSGRNRATRFTRELEEEREVNRALERDLADAFEGGQLRMVYQPIHLVGHGAADGGGDGEPREVEALVRWRHPTLGEISPARFIPAAERSGLMVQLGAWIVERALADLARWPEMGMSINLSPLQLQQDGFVGFVMDCCARHRITPRRVTLEVTESLSIERNTRALLTLNLLRNAGFRIALDDFGTGYSSLCMMKTFRFDRLKLDRSLISDIGKDPTSQAVFDAAVTMALRIGAEVVAEGISEPGLVDPVRSAGCTHVQGFHYSRPIEVDGVAHYYDAECADLPARRIA